MKRASYFLWSGAKRRRTVIRGINCSSLAPRPQRTSSLTCTTGA